MWPDACRCVAKRLERCDTTHCLCSVPVPPYLCSKCGIIIASPPHACATRSKAKQQVSSVARNATHAHYPSWALCFVAQWIITRASALLFSPGGIRMHKVVVQSYALITTCVIDVGGAVQPSTAVAKQRGSKRLHGVPLSVFITHGMKLTAAARSKYFAMCFGMVRCALDCTICKLRTK